MTFLFAAYTIYFHARWGQTLGKMAAGIRVIKASGSPIEWREALLRSSADTVFSMVLLVASMYALIRMPASQFTSLGWMAREKQLKLLEPAWRPSVSAAYNVWFWSEVVTLLFNRQRRALHDFITGTVVVHVAANPPAEDPSYARV